MKYVYYLAGSFVALLFGPGFAFADVATAAASVPSYISLGAGLGISLAVIGGALSQAKVVSSIAESIGRNPSASGKLNVPLFVGLALIESLVILAFVIALNLANKA